MFTNERTSRRRAPLRHGQQHPACGGDDGRCVTTKPTTSFPINRGSVFRIKSIPVNKNKNLTEIPFISFIRMS